MLLTNSHTLTGHTTHATHATTIRAALLNAQDFFPLSIKTAIALFCSVAQDMTNVCMHTDSMIGMTLSMFVIEDAVMIVNNNTLWDLLGSETLMRPVT